MIPMLGIGLAILSALCCGGLDAIRKQLSVHLNALPLTFWLIIGQWPVFLLWVISSGEAELSFDWLLPGSVVAILAIAGAIMFIKAVQMSALSLVIPMLSFTPVFAVLTSVLVLGELPTLRQIIGIGVIVSGAFTLGWAGTKVGSQGFREPGIWLMIAVALCWASTLTFEKLALRYAMVPIHALSLSVLMGILMFLILMLQGSLSELKEITHYKKLYLWAIISSSLATGTQLLAITVVQVGVVEAIKRSIGLALSVLSGWLFFKEPPTLVKQLAIAWMGVGVLILVL